MGRSLGTDLLVLDDKLSRMDLQNRDGEGALRVKKLALPGKEVES